MLEGTCHMVTCPPGKVKDLLRAQGKVTQLEAGINTVCCFSGLQDGRVEVGSWFHHSLGDKSYRLFSSVTGQRSLACPNFTQCTDLSKAAVNQSDILLC